MAGKMGQKSDQTETSILSKLDSDIKVRGAGKSYFFSGPVTKSGGGCKGRATKKKELFFLNYFD